MSDVESGEKWSVEVINEALKNDDVMNTIISKMIDIEEVE